MPLKKPASKGAGKLQKQAVAIALEVQRRTKKKGKK